MQVGRRTVLSTRSSVDDIISTSGTKLWGESMDPSCMQASSSSSGCVYRAEKIIGNGSFGIVYQAVSEDTGLVYAIKKVYQDRRYKNRELQIMKELGVHPNIVKLENAFYTSSKSSSSEKPEELFLNLVLEYVPDTIYKLLKTSQKSKQQIPLIVTKCYIYQLARGLAYMHSIGICHRDIKPQNLLICPKTHMLKLCDFGSAKRLVSGEPNVSYICSRYYRAPELIFGSTDYSNVVDVWSVGCVLGELLLGAPLFPGENGVDQLVQIIKIIGTPTSEDLLAMNPNYTEFRFPSIKSNTWENVLSPTEPTPVTILLLKNILQYNPKRRLSCSEIVNHEFFHGLKDSAAISIPSNLFEYSQIERKYLSFSSNPAASIDAIADCRTRSGSTE